MSRKLFSVRRLAPLGVLALVAGAAGAQAAGGGSASPKPAAPRAVSAAVPVAPTPLNCRPSGKKPDSAPPSDALKSAFGILRRERTDDDALPARALKAIERRGWEVVAPSATRLLRADRRARAWVVPVPDVAAMPSIVCRGAAASTRARARARARARGRVGGPPAPVAAAKPREGLVVVSVGGAPGGGGGALRDLQRGLAPPSVDPCAGANRDMVGVSGIVPDGVDAVFVTAADGSATRADVHDNGYAFVLPRSPRPDSRYLVWTAADGTPRVRPLPALAMFFHIGRCRDNGARTPVTVTPDPWSASCGPAPASVVFSTRPPRAAIPVRPGPARVRRGRTAVVPAHPLPATLPAPLPLTVCPAIEAPPVGLPPVLRAPRPVSPRTLRQVPAPPAAPAPRAPQELPAPSAAPVPRAPRVPRANPAPTAPAAPKPVAPRAP